MGLCWWMLACLIWETQGPMLYAAPLMPRGQPPPMPSPCSALMPTLRHHQALPPRCQPPSSTQHLAPSSMPPPQHPPVLPQHVPSRPSTLSPMLSQPSSEQQRPANEVPSPLPRKSPQLPPKKDKGNKLAVLVGGILGSLVVLILIAIFVVLVIKLVWKRNGHTPPVEGRGHHNRDTTYTYREPSPYECPARQPQCHDYAELEGQGSYGSSIRQPQSPFHLYEEAEKYFRGVNDEDYANPGYQLNVKGANGKRPQFQCIITPPPEDDYANPADAVTNDNIQESGVVDECQTKVAELHNYATLEQDMKGNGTGNDKGMEKEGDTTEISDCSLP